MPKIQKKNKIEQSTKIFIYRDLKFAITKTWQEIPTKIKTLSYHKFKKEYKRILVNSQR